MMDINRIEICVAEFAKNYNLLQWKDISNLVTKSKPRFTKKQLQMDGRTFVEITKHKERYGTDIHYLLCIGKIYFILESSSKEDIYSVDTESSIVINLSEFSDEQTLIDTILEKCKVYNYL